MSSSVLQLFAILAGVTLVLATSEEVPTTCEHLKVEQCVDVGYNVTSVPKILPDFNQDLVEIHLNNLQPLFDTHCSSHLKQFLCNAYVPLCLENVAAVGPCRSVCEKVHADCASAMLDLGYRWPKELLCDNFYVDDDNHHLCMMLMN